MDISGLKCYYFRRKMNLDSNINWQFGYIITDSMQRAIDIFKESFKQDPDILQEFETGEIYISKKEPYDKDPFNKFCFTEDID